jgi:CRP-like cAMP-binding protein
VLCGRQARVRTAATARRRETLISGRRGIERIVGRSSLPARSRLSSSGSLRFLLPSVFFELTCGQPGAAIRRASAVQENQLLAALAPNRYRQLEGGLEEVELRFGEILHSPGDPPSHVYFPTNSLVSLLVGTGAGELEVGLVGKESMVGIPLALGQSASPVRALVQGEGRALRMKARRFRREIERNGDFKKEIDRCTYVAMTTAMQIAACNNKHVLAARLARWLLMVRDRLGRDQFRMTQEFLAVMLGVRRAGVTDAAGALQRRRLIRYVRGRMEILQADALQAAACSCYKVIRKLETGSAR